MTENESLEVAEGQAAQGQAAQGQAAQHQAAAAEVPSNLRQLIGDEEERDEAPVPGETESSARQSLETSPSAPEVNWSSFAEALKSSAQDQTSALTKSRALSVAGFIRTHLGDDEEAESLFSQASEVSPRLGLTSLLLRKKCLDSHSDTLKRSTEVTLRHAGNPSTRRHTAQALLSLVDRMSPRDDSPRNDSSPNAIDEYGALLDREARTDSSDHALQLTRLAHRIATGQSLAGVEMDPRVRDFVLFAEEFISLRAGHTTRFDPEGSFGDAPSLHLLRATRLLASCHYEAAIDELEAAGVARDSILRFRAAAAATQGGKSALARDQLRRLAESQPSRGLLRNLASRALQTQDDETLRWVLETADPGAGTFELYERVLLEAVLGEVARLSLEERQAMCADAPDLALALGPPEETVLVPDEARPDALLAQLGSQMHGLIRVDDARWERVLAATSELEERDLEPLLTAAVRLAHALLAEPGPVAVSALQHFSTVAGHPEGSIATALLAERVLSAEDAHPYQETAREHPVYAEAALRALRRFDPMTFAADLAAMAEQTRSPWLRLNRNLEVFFASLWAAPDSGPGSTTDDQAPQVDLEPLRAALGDFYASIQNSPQSGSPLLYSECSLFAFAASVVARLRVDAAQTEEFQELVGVGPTAPAQLVAFGRSFETQLGNAAEPRAFPKAGDFPSASQLALWHEASDVTARVLARTYESEPSSSAPLALGEAKRASLEEAGLLVEHLFRGQWDDLGPLCRSVREHLADSQGALDDIDELRGDWERLSSNWLHVARNGETKDERMFALQRLSDLDRRKGDPQSATMWQRALVEEFPDAIESILIVQEDDCAQGIDRDQAQYRERIAQSLSPADRQSYALLNGALALCRSDLRRARLELEPFLSDPNPPSFVLRALYLVAQEKRDDELAARVDERLYTRATTDLDRASAALRVAYRLCRAEQRELARVWTQRALEANPRYFSAAQLHAQLQDDTQTVERAEALETFAESSHAYAHRTELYFVAARAWLEVDDSQRAASCLEATLAASPHHQEAFQRLLELRHDAGDRPAEERLIENRLALIPESGRESLALTLRLVDVLLELNRPEVAKEYLEKILVHHPDHALALRAHADISAKLGAHESAERSLVALRDRLEAGPERSAVLYSLARLYNEELRQWERAMDAYQAVLAVEPTNRPAKKALVDIYARLNLGDRAAQLQTEVIVEAKNAEEKRSGALKLAELYETVGHDPKLAAATLERTRKAWPLNADVLEAAVRFMDRQGGGPRGFTLDRAAKDTRRKLEQERISADLLDTLARIAMLSGAHAQYEACLSVRAAYLGEESTPLSPGGLAALGEQLEETLAPPGMSRPLRTLFKKTGAAMDAAFAVDLSSFHPRPLDLNAPPEASLFQRIQEIAARLRLGNVEVFVSDRTGARCLPITTQPPRVLIGSGLPLLEDKARDYLLLRAFKLEEMGVSALSRSRTEDRFPMIVALLHLFAPGWRPPQVDGKKAAQAKALIEKGLARVGYDDDVPMLALEAIGALGGQSHALGVASKQLASRAALLGVGDVTAVLSAIGSSESKPVPQGGPSRFRWVEAHPEARELLLFGTSAAFTRARTALGLTTEPSSSPLASSRAESPSRGESLSPGPPPPPARSAPRAAPPPPRRPGAPPAPPRRDKPKE